MCDIVWIYPQSHSSLSVKPHRCTKSRLLNDGGGMTVVVVVMVVMVTVMKIL